MRLIKLLISIIYSISDSEAPVPRPRPTSSAGSTEAAGRLGVILRRPPGSAAEQSTYQ